MASQRIAVIGAGIIGLALARHLALGDSDADVTVIEKEGHVAAHQTGHNSGVVHAGVYYPPNSLKAVLCRRGVGLLRTYCQERKLAYDECGKLIVARTQQEAGRLTTIRRHAERNGVPDLRWLDGRQLQDIEPSVAGIAALHSPTTAITDFAAIAESFAQDVVQAGGKLRLRSTVTGLDVKGRQATVTVAGERLVFDRVIICAGLQADRLAREAGDTPDPMIVPFRGEYLRLAVGCEGLVRGLIYPVPDPRYPFLGVHFTRRVDNTVEIGPNAVLALAREGYRWRAISVRDVAEMVRFRGLHRLGRKHWKAGMREVAGSLARRIYVAQAQSYVPALRRQDLLSGRAGVRAQALDRNGTLLDDFCISHLGPVTALRNAPSPGATSALAIAEHIARGIEPETAVSKERRPQPRNA